MIALVGVDVLFYAYHRIAHRVRLVWATHQAHHSSRYFNFATALRQKWNNSGELIMWDAVAAPGCSAVDGIHQLLDQPGLPVLDSHRTHRNPAEAVRVPVQYPVAPSRPSRNRSEYLDKNYGGILIIWDRIFGTFQPETFRPHYGLTKPVNTFNIWSLETHEYVAIARDVRTAARWRDKLGYIFGPPGWEPTLTALAAATSTAGAS